MSAFNPMFSIVTVCRNAGSLLGPTMASVRRQSCRDYEYLVIDGASTDTTVDVVRSYGDLVTTYVCEPDQGIYDAMNKGVRLARGQWIYFLNANDFFAGDTVLERIKVELAKAPASDLCFGDVYHRTDGVDTLLRFDSVNRWNLRCEHLCHQTVLAHRSLFERFGTFDLQYRINADYDWLLRVFAAGIDAHYLGFPVASYDTGGLSSRDLDMVMAERRLVRQRHRPPLSRHLIEWAYRIYRRIRRVAGLDSQRHAHGKQTASTEGQV